MLINRAAWLNITTYYSAAFKTGSYPPIETDQIYMWARTHPANARASNDPVGPPSNANLVSFSVVLESLPKLTSHIVPRCSLGHGNGHAAFDCCAFYKCQSCSGSRKFSSPGRRQPTVDPYKSWWGHVRCNHAWKSNNSPAPPAELPLQWESCPV